MARTKKTNPRLWTTLLAVIEATPQAQPYVLRTASGKLLAVVPRVKRLDLTPAQLDTLPIAALRRARPAEMFGWAMAEFERYNHDRTTGRSARKSALDEN